MKRPTAIRVTPNNDFTLTVKFDNNEIRLFDVKPYIKGTWFGELSDIALFNSVHIAGLSIEWANGQDICPDDLYYNSVPCGDTHE